MDSAANSAVDASADDRLDPGSVAEVQAEFKLWLEAFTGETLTSDETVLDSVSGLIATAEPEALDLLGERLHDLLADLVGVAEETGEEIAESYFAAIEGVISAIDLRLTPIEEIAEA